MSLMGPFQLGILFCDSVISGLCRCDCFSALTGNFKYDLNMKVYSRTLLIMHPYVILKKKGKL